MTIGLILKQSADRWPEREALIEGQQRITYRQLSYTVNCFANGLRSMGIERGDTVGLFAANSVELVVSYLAIQTIGSVAVPVNPRLAAGELADILCDARAVALICDGDRVDVASQTSEEIPSVTHWISTEPVNEMQSFDAVIEEESMTDPSVDVDLEDPAVLMHTSGTTGRPKLVVIDHLSQLLNSMSCLVELNIEHDDRVLHVAPLYHSAGYLNLFLPALQVGATHVLQPTFDPNETLRRIEAERITVSLGVPTHFQKLRMANLASYDTGSLRTLLTSGAPVPKTTAAWVINHLCERFVNVYGLTETTGLVTVARSFDSEDRGSRIGQPFLNVEVRLIDADKNASPADTVEPGERGQLLVRSPKLMQEYLDQPAKTAETIRDGWLYTGDVAVRRGGTYYLIDRMDNVIITGGENVYPQEVEDVLDDHPDLVESAVVGEPDPELGERVIAYAVASDPTLSLADLDTFWSEQTEVAGFKRPRKLTLVDSIPRSSSGKVVREELGSRGGG